MAFLSRDEVQDGVHVIAVVDHVVGVTVEEGPREGLHAEALL